MLTLCVQALAEFKFESYTSKKTGSTYAGGKAGRPHLHPHPHSTRAYTLHPTPLLLLTSCTQLQEVS